jgi:hypothetical protein
LRWGWILSIHIYLALLLVVVQQQGLSTGALVLLLHKLLQPSDVTSLGRIVLPKVCIVKTHPFSLSTAEETMCLVFSYHNTCYPRDFGSCDTQYTYYMCEVSFVVSNISR